MAIKSKPQLGCVNMEKGHACCENEVVIEKDIAPWALPYEKIPLHIKP